MSKAEKLRQARKERLEAKELDFEYGTPPNKKYKQQVPSPTITKLKDEPEDWGQYRLKASDMALDLNASGDEWAVVNRHDDRVFYTIKPTAETKEIFATREFAEMVINDVREMGIEAAMEKYSAFPAEFLKKDDGEEGDLPMKPKPKMKMKPKMDDKKPGLPMKPKPKPKMDLGDDIEEEACGMRASEKTADEEVDAVSAEAEEAIDAPIEEEAAEEEVAAEPAEEVVEEEAVAPTASMNDLRRRFVRAFRLALSAQQKNLTDNPLKGAWFEALTELGIENPETVIEATFARAAAEHFEVALAKTAEFLNMTDEAFVEMEAQIGELNTQSPKTASEVEQSERTKKAAALRARATEASLPLSSATDADATGSVADRISAALPKPKLHGVSQLVNR